MHSFTWALPTGYDWDIKKFAKAVKTKSWAKKHAKSLSIAANRLTSEGANTRTIIHKMLTDAYGVNIGNQVNEKIPDSDLETIKWNIIKSQYS
jgi:hypothetical protein